MPRNLIKIDLEKLNEYIFSKLKQFPEIEGAYLFGSCLEMMRPESDIDLGIIFKENLKSQNVDFIIEKIYRFLGHFDNHPFDIVSLRDVNTILAFKIIHKGQLVYISNKDSVTDFIEITSKKYSDVYPRYKKALEIITGLRGENFDS